MLEMGIAKEAVSDDTLWEAIRHHREIFTSIRDVDYTPDVRKRICLIPPKEVIDIWKEDYDAMVLNMIYDEVRPTFNDILRSAQIIERMFKQN